MPKIVRLITDKNRGNEVFVPLEQTPVLLSRVRRALPQLERDLRREWPVQQVELENRIPRRKNPYDPTAVAIVKVACVGIVVKFGLSAAKAAGAKVGDVMGQEIAKCVRGWIRRIDKLKAAANKSPRARRRSTSR